MKTLTVNDLPDEFRFYVVYVQGGVKHFLTKTELDAVVTSASQLVYIKRIDAHINRMYIISTRFDREATKEYFQDNREMILKRIEGNQYDKNNV